MYYYSHSLSSMIQDILRIRNIYRNCFSLFTILHSGRFDFLLIGLPPAPNRKFEALQTAVNALTAAGLKVSFTSHPRQDLCHQAGRHWLWNRLQPMRRWGFLIRQVLPSLLLGGWAALGKDCGELRKRNVTTLGERVDGEILLRTWV